MSGQENSLERIPVSAAVARELGMVATRARGRVMAPILAAVPVLWFVEFSGLQGENGSTPAQAALLATLFAGGVAVIVTLIVLRWARHIAFEPFIVRERGRFGAGGSFAAWFYGTKTEYSITSALGPLRLDKDERHDRLAGVREILRAKLPGDDQFEIDYTPHRYLLAVVRLDGSTLFARTGYVPPRTAETIPTSVRQLKELVDSGWSEALLCIGLGLACAVGLVILFVATPMDSFLMTSGGATVLFIALMVGIVYFLPTGLFRVMLIAGRAIR